MNLFQELSNVGAIKCSITNEHKIFFEWLENTKKVCQFFFKLLTISINTLFDITHIGNEFANIGAPESNKTNNRKSQKKIPEKIHFDYFF